MNEEFKKDLQANNVQLTLDFHIQILSSGSWPFTQCQEFALPLEVSSFSSTLDVPRGLIDSICLSWSIVSGHLLIITTKNTVDES